MGNDSDFPLWRELDRDFESVERAVRFVMEELWFGDAMRAESALAMTKTDESNIESREFQIALGILDDHRRFIAAHKV